MYVMTWDDIEHLQRAFLFSALASILDQQKHEQIFHLAQSSARRPPQPFCESWASEKTEKTGWETTSYVFPIFEIFL